MYPGHGTRRALVVEDNRAIATVFSRLLEFRGISSETLENGEAALERLALEVFDFVLMDVRMPVLDGIEATRRIRAREIRSGLHVPIVAITADNVCGMRQRCLLAGMDGFVDKPLRIEHLFREIDRVLGEHL